MAENIRILLADDHPVLRSGLDALLSLEDGLQVVGQASRARRRSRRRACSAPTWW